MVIPRFVKASLENKPLNIFGDGSQARVFCHVKDTVRAILTLIENDKTIGEVFNIGGKGEISILDLANLIIKIGNSKSSINFIDYIDAYPIGYEDMQHRNPDISKISAVTGWVPNLDLNIIIRDVYKNFR